MELLVLDPDLKLISVFDTFESLIWTNKYDGYGDFEIYTKASVDLLSVLAQGNYLALKESDSVMVIEDCKIETDADNGSHMIFSGRSVESILDRRIVWNQTVLTGNLQNGIKKLIDENVISPTIPDRTIPNFIFEVSTDERITALTVDAQFIRTNLYESISKLCLSYGLGFKLTLDYSTNKLIFELYIGEDRSFDQILNPYVIFSPQFDNIVSSSYSDSKKIFKNVVFVKGEGDETLSKKTTAGEATGILRKEAFLDAKDISQTVDEEWISDAEYIAQLKQKGEEYLAETLKTNAFDAKVDFTRIYKYGEDFFLGDIVQIVDAYGISIKARITEVTYSQKNNEVGVYPIFTILS